ncbi:MAG: response regulator [Zavarzinia sp.]|nr:response regulator [Zavarzinia sp.]
MTAAISVAYVAVAILLIGRVDETRDLIYSRFLNGSASALRMELAFSRLRGAATAGRLDPRSLRAQELRSLYDTFLGRFRALLEGADAETLRRVPEVASELVRLRSALQTLDRQLSPVGGGFADPVAARRILEDQMGAIEDSVRLITRQAATIESTALDRTALDETIKQITLVITALFLLGLAIVALSLSLVQRARLLQEEAETARRRALRLELAIADSNDGIVLVDAEDRIVAINRAMLAMFGMAREADAIGHRWTEFYPPAERARLVEAMAPALARDGHFRGTAACCKDDGTVDQEVSLTQLDDGGRLLIARDISRQLADDRTRHMLEVQLANAQKMEAIGRLTSGFAHDFNNILASVQGYAEILQEDAEPESPGWRFSGRILAATRRGRVLVDRILSFGRPARGGAVSCDLNAALDEAAALLAGAMPASIRIETSFGPSGIPVAVSADEMAQVLMNIGVNARDAMADKGGALSFEVMSNPAETPPSPMDDWPTVSLGQLQGGRRYVRVRITDTGNGIPEASLGRIFEPFYTTKAAGAGTGLGLAAVHNIVTGAGGQVVLASRPGLGSRLDLCLPIAEAAPGAGADTGTFARKTRPLSVLIIEDDTMLGEAVAETLNRSGYKVEIVHDGENALRRIAEASPPFDVILTDEAMPGMRGSELIRRLRDNGNNIPAVLWSGNAPPDLVTGPDGPGGRTAFCRKPVAADELLAAIARVVDETPSTQGAPLAS